MKLWSSGLIGDVTGFGAAKAACTSFATTSLNAFDVGIPYCRNWYFC